MLGVEVPRTTLQTQTSIPYFYVDPPTEIFNNSITGTQIGTLGDGTQIWKITHNGVDTHAIHWHMFNVQVLNRVGWDGAVKPPYAYELGWKETVKMRPLEDIIVAMRPINPNLPASWGQLPNSIRPLDPTNPLGSATSMQFHNIDPNNNPAPVVNHLVNYGLEYVWHCHLLGHEEFDMMRAMAVAVAPIGSPAITGAGYVNDTVNKTNVTVFISFTDQSTIETHWTLQRQNLTSSNWTDIQRVPSYTGPQMGGVGIVSDSTLPPNSSVNTQRYRILAANVVGDATDYGDPAIGYPTIAANSSPSATISAFTNNPANVTALFDGNPKTGVNAPLTVTFTDQSVGASGWSWNFGDGDSTNATGIQNPIHTYMNTGIYRVNLTTTSIGGYNTTSKPAFITVGPITSPIAPVANFTATPVNGSAPLTVNFRDLSVNATTWYWTFGDNWSYGNITTSNSTLMNPVHTYLTAGNYTVSLNVTNSAGSNVTKKMGYINVTDAADKIGVYRNGYWFLDSNNNGTWDGTSNDAIFYLGGPGNATVTGDWNGNGRDKIGIFNISRGQWYLDYNGNGVLDAIDASRTTTYNISFGMAGDQPVSGYWDGIGNPNGTSNVGVFRNGIWYVDWNGNGAWDAVDAAHTKGPFGQAGDIAVAGDWNGNRTTKIGVFRNGFWYVDWNNNGIWDAEDAQHIGFFGQAGDGPVIGDWTGDGISKFGVLRNGIWYVDWNGNGQWDVVDAAHTKGPFGQAGDIPVAGKW
jgi:PKD repeat protein